jgi:hypothetical protein
MPETLLFGGAMACSVPGDEWKDLADIRQVPDHQECRLDNSGRLLVLEILDYQSDVEDAQAARYLFQDLAHANGAAEVLSFVNNTTTLSLSSPLEEDIPEYSMANRFPTDSSICFGTGLQRIAVVGQTQLDIVSSSGSTSSTPSSSNRQHETNVAGQSLLQVQLCVIRLPSVQSELLVTLSTPCDEDESSLMSSSLSASLLLSTDIFREVLSTLQVRDWSLFG